MQLQIEVKCKTLGRSVTIRPKSVEKHLIKGTLKNLTTPTCYVVKMSEKSSTKADFWSKNKKEMSDDGR